VAIAAIIVGVAAVGLALMLSRAFELTLGQGDDRVALYLARQKIEKLAGGGFASLLIGDNVNDGGCPSPPDPNNPAERCYNETNLAGLGDQGASSAALDRQRFTRRTCVRNVNDDAPTLPADTPDPATWTCPSCAPGGTCTGNTKRVKVAVTPLMPQANSVTLESVLIDPTQGPAAVISTTTGIPVTTCSPSPC
jgi:hypothetical protein